MLCDMFLMRCRSLDHLIFKASHFLTTKHYTCSPFETQMVKRNQAYTSKLPHLEASHLTLYLRQAASQRLNTTLVLLLGHKWLESQCQNEVCFQAPFCACLAMSLILTLSSSWPPMLAKRLS